MSHNIFTKMAFLHATAVVDDDVSLFQELSYLYPYEASFPHPFLQFQFPFLSSVS